MPGYRTDILTLVLLALALLIPYQAATPEKASNPKPREQAEVILARAKAVYDLSAAGAPYKLSARLRVMDPDGGVLTGQLICYWAAPEKWKRDITVGESGETEWQVGGKTCLVKRGAWHAKEAAVALGLRTPLEELPVSWTFSEKSEVVCSKHKGKGGASTIDVIDQNRDMGLRFAEDTGELLRADTTTGFSTTYESQRQKDKLVVAKASTFVNDKLVEEWNLTELTWVDSHDPVLWVLPEGAKTWDTCDSDHKNPKVLKQPYIPYPTQAMAKGLRGRVVVSILIGADGEVQDMFVVQSTYPVFAETARSIAKQFVYKVPPCLLQAAPVDSRFTLNFQPSK